MDGNCANKCVFCKESLGESFSNNCKCDQCNLIFHSQCAKMRNISKCIRCERNLPIPGPSSGGSSSKKAQSVRSNRSSKSSLKSIVNLDIEHLRREEELYMQQQQEKQWLLEDKHKRQESFLKRKIELERQLNAASENGEETDDEEFHSACDVAQSIQKVKEWQTPTDNSQSNEQEENVYASAVQSSEPATGYKQPDPSKNTNPFMVEKDKEGDSIYFSVQSSKHASGYKQPDPPIPKNTNPFIVEKPICSKFAEKNYLPRDSWSARQVIRLDLPSFDGNPEEWPAFLSTFNSTTSLCCIQDVENIRRLDKALKGSARKAVSGLLLFPDKLHTIMGRLRLLFGREDLIINSQIEKLRSDHCPVTMDSIESIIEYATKVENISSQMLQADMKYHLWNPALLQELVEKLPSVLKLEWAERRSQFNTVNIETFSTWLFEKAMKASLVLTKPLRFESPKKKVTRTVNVHSEVEKSQCCICDGDCQQLTECKKFLSMNRKERWNAVNVNNRCGQCLKSHGGRCFQSKNCGVDNCTLKHHPLLHKFDENSSEVAKVNHHSDSNGSTFFKIVPVVIHCNNRSVSTFAMLDDGSSLTLMEQDLANSLKLTGTPEPLCLKWTGDTTKMEENSVRASIEVSSNLSRKRFAMKVRTVSSLNLPIQTVVGSDVKEQFSKTTDIECPTYANVQPQILIGLDNPTLLANTKAHFSKSGNLVIAKTKLGWTVFGANSNRSKRVFHVCECQTLNKAFKEFIALDNLGVTSESFSMLSDVDMRANGIMENSTTYKNGHYEMPLLWKYDKIVLPPSYTMARRRLSCLVNKFKKDPALKSVMDSQISDYLTKGYARILSDEEVKATSHMLNWYLPVFVVRNPNKPSKVRIVWDAAAKVGNVSLNDLLLKGPDLLNNLPGVLFRFRQWAVALTGDIREMFHQIKIRPEDQMFQRFLWFMENDEEPKVLAMQVMTFGASCSPCCAQYVKNLNAKKFEKDYPRAVESIVKNHYVDDLLDSVPTEDMAVALAKEVREIHSFAGFEIRSWKSNSRVVLNALEESSESEQLDLNLECELPLEKVLGMFWHIDGDSFTYSLKFNKSNYDILHGVKAPTKREMLRLVMSIYDPLGFLSHFLIYPKILLQELWRKKLLWDEEISDELAEKWSVWVKQLPSLEDVRIPRHYHLTPDSCNPDIHVFVDASEQAYAAVAYLRLESGNEVKCSLIAAKSRVAPLKPLTIPRLELLAAVLGTRLEHHIRKEHSITFKNTFFWSDSKTVLSWIRSDMRNFKPYVACRISEILESTKAEQWRWTPTELNIADVSTRICVVNMNSSTTWFQGPPFLYGHENQWPQQINVSDTLEESRSSFTTAKVLHIGFVNPTRFSNWNRMLRSQAWALRFVNNLRTEKSARNCSELLDKSELLDAEQWIFKNAQSDMYQTEIQQLISGKKVICKKSSIYKKLPFLDSNGLLRSKGRLDKMIQADDDLRNPIILPRNHATTHLIILSYHRRFHHHNHETIVNELRQKFYIPNLRTEYKQVKSSCQKCKNDNAKPSDPQMSTLPQARLEPYTEPFTYTGIDFFGPMTVSVNRKTAKRYGVIFTCLNIRAVHIEIAHSLTTDSCIIALRNFMNRRCVPAEIYSDNGTNLKGASKELKEQISKIDKSKLAEQFISPTTAWYFNPPGCPHMGGAWERLVRSIKTTLSHIHIPRNPSDEVLNSTMIEIENVINSRPLTYLPIEDCDSESLTPNHFLKGSSSGARKLGDCSIEKEVLVRNWKCSQQIANLFWKRWVVEYLPSLNRRVKWFDPEREIVIGDIVVIIDEKQNRNTWQKGVVVDVQRSRDGKVRKADVKTSTNTYTRAAVKLAILDVRQTPTLDSEHRDNVPEAGVTSNTTNLIHATATPNLTNSIS